MEKSQAIKMIQSRKAILSEGAYNLRVTNVSQYDGKYIINFAAMTQYHIDEAKRLLREGTDEAIQTAVNQNVSASLLPTHTIPSKGEIVKVVVERRTTKNGVNGLFPVSISELKAKETTNVSLDFDEEELDETIEQPQLISNKKSK